MINTAIFEDILFSEGNQTTAKWSENMVTAMGEIQLGTEAVLYSSPQPTLKGKEGKAGGKGQPPAPPQPPALRAGRARAEIGGLRLWLTAERGIQQEVF